MSEALVFASQNQLDFQDIRTNVIRIPEVVMRIREAQKIWDSLELPPLDIANFVASDDGVFLSHIRLKAFATAIIQIGLLDRYLKTNPLPEYIVGLTNEDSPLRFVTGELSFFELVNQSALKAIPRKLQSVNTTDLPILSGVQLAKFSAYRRRPEGAYQVLEDANVTQMERLVDALIAKNNVQSFIVIGPGNCVVKTSDSVGVRDSIDMDPALGWFWQTSALDLVSAN
jgi:hypothetical protein